MKRFIALILIVLLTFPSVALGADAAAYNLNNGYIAVKESVFNSLIENDKLAPFYKEELSNTKEMLNSLQEEYENKDKIKSEKITTLEDIISKDETIIATQKENLASYESMYKIEKKEVKKYKTQAFVCKVLIIGLGAYAILK